MNYITAALHHLQAIGDEPVGSAWDDRRMAYALYELYVDNRVYRDLQDGGQRSYINQALGGAAAANLSGLYNPTEAVVSLYQHVFGGEFGVDIRLDPAYSSAAVIAAVDRIWKRSNMNRQKQLLCRTAPTTGNVGLRIVMRNDADVAKRRVYLKVEHPRIIRDVERDERGNVIAIELEYDLTDGIGEQQDTYTIREVLTPETILTYRIRDNDELIPFDLTTMTDYGPFAAYDNPLGIVPYVLLDHEVRGGAWGANAFHRALDPINHLNALLTHINTQIHDHVDTTWFMGAAGPPPVSVNLNGRSIAYVDTRSVGAGAAPPFMEPLVAPLNLADSIAQSRHTIELIEDMLPELKATAGKFLAGQSGQTIAELRKPAEDRVALARINYEDAVIRAQQIALSAGVLYELWDLGTGMGTREAAEAAYQSGAEDHRFISRPLLAADAQPMTGGAA